MSVCECLSYGKCMEKFRQFQMFGWKISTKSRFFRGRDENWTIWCRGFVCMSSFKSSVFVDVEVVCACRPSTRPSSRLFVKHSTLHRLQPLSLTFVLLFGLLFVKAFVRPYGLLKALWPYLRLFSFTLFSFTRG